MTKLNESISVVFPAYNEESNIGILIDKTIQILNECIDKWEIIVVDDGSNDRTTEIVKKYGEDKIREILVKKALKKLLGNTRYLVDRFKNVFLDKNHKNEIKKIIIKFLDKDDKDIKETYGEFEKILGGKRKGKKNGKTKSKKSCKISTSISSDKFVYTYISITKQQQTKINNIRPIFESIANNYSNEEYEYIKEALFCLEKDCAND